MSTKDHLRKIDEELQAHKTEIDRLYESISKLRSEPHTGETNTIVRSFVVDYGPLLVSILTGLFIAFQWIEMHKAGPISETAANAAKSAAETAAKTLEATQAQFRTDERPYLFVTPRSGNSQGLVIAPLGGDKYTVDVAIEYKNGGKTPAVRVNPTEYVFMVGPAEKVSQEARAYVPEYKNQSGAVVGTGESHTAPTFPTKRSTASRLIPKVCHWRTVRSETQLGRRGTETIEGPQGDAVSPKIAHFAPLVYFRVTPKCSPYFPPRRLGPHPY